MDYAPLLLAVLISYLAPLTCLFSSHHIRRLIGRTEDDILSRLLGFILAALAIQFIVDGVRQFSTD